MKEVEMTMTPRPTFDFSKVVNTDVTHTLLDQKLVLSAVQVYGNLADAEALASTTAPDGVSQTLTVSSADLWHTSAYSESIAGTNGAYANWI
jgi:hypothetical protein